MCQASSLLSSSSSSSSALKRSVDVLYVLSCVCEHLEVHGSEYVSQFARFRVVVCCQLWQDQICVVMRLSPSQCNMLVVVVRMVWWFALKCVDLSWV